MCTCLLRGSLVYVVCIKTIIDFQYVELFLYLKTNINAFVCLSTLRYHCYTSYATLVCNYHSFVLTWICILGRGTYIWK